MSNKMPDVTIYDNGSAYMICVDGMIVTYKNSLGDAWRHIVWMYRIATQHFTVDGMPVTDWIDRMKKNGYL